MRAILSVRIGRNEGKNEFGIHRATGQRRDFTTEPSAASARRQRDETCEGQGTKRPAHDLGSRAKENCGGAKGTVGEVEGGEQKGGVERVSGLPSLLRA